MSNAFSSLFRITFKFLFSKEILTLFLILSVTAAFSQKVNISGSFWDDNSGVNLKTQVYGLKDGQKVKLAETDTKNLFNFQLQTDIQELVFESDGYISVSFPIHFVGKFGKTSSAKISVNSNGGFSQYQYKDLIIFCLPSTHQNGNKYELLTVREDTIFRNMDFTILVENKISADYLLSEKSLQNNYKVVTSNSNNETIQENDFLANKGLTFVDINSYPTEILAESYQKNGLSEISVKENKAEPSIEVKIIYPTIPLGVVPFILIKVSLNLNQKID